MALYHLEAKVISRGVGRSAVAASAYMSCSSLYNDYDGIRHDYTRKQGLVWTRVFLPDNAPTEWADREKLWNAVEEAEKTKDSRLARELVVALPVELRIAEWQRLLTAFIREQFAADGMCADVAIHNPHPPGHNPHAHILLTVRPLDEHGNWQSKTEKEYLCIRNGVERGFTAAEYKTAQAEGWEKQYSYRVGKKKVYMTPSEAAAHGYERVNKYPKSTRYGRQNPITARWNSEEQLITWRKAWADRTNLSLERTGHTERIDHRSHADRGLDEQPTVHEGVEARAMEKKGIISDHCALNRKIKADNALLRELKATVKALSRKVKQTVPEIAEKLEKLRENLIVTHYQYHYNKELLAAFREFMHRDVPIIKEVQGIMKQIKQKSKERKQLPAVKDATPIWSAAKQLRLASQITTLTEDMEELKSRKLKLMDDLDCIGEGDLKNLETKAAAMPETQKKVQNRQRDLVQNRQSLEQEYAETLAAVEPQDLLSLNAERQRIRYVRETALIENLHSRYGDDFSRREYENSVEAVDAALPTRVISREQEQKSIHERLQANRKQQEQERQTHQEQRKKRQGMEL